MITEQELLDYGFKKQTDDPLYPYIKVLSDPQPEDEDAGNIFLAVSLENNFAHFVLNTGYDVEVVLNIKDVSDLANLELLIAGTRPTY
jgi:hypothetical protein